MATPRISSLSRTLFAATNKQTLTSFLLSRSFASSSTIGASSATAASSLSISSSLFRLRPLAAFGFYRISPAPASSGGFRAFSTRQSQASLNDNSPNWSNRPPKETILLDGCDFEHWLVVTEPPPEGATRDEIIDSYIKTLSQVVGSEEEARMKIYSVSTRCYFAFGALVSEELSYKLKELPNVRWVLPDSYLDVKNKDYGGEPFINGQAVPYDPKYHEEWIRNNQKAMERNRRNDRPRNADRSRNFERRQRNQEANMGGQPVGPPMPNQPVGAPNNAGYGQNMPPNNPGGYGQTMPPPNNPGYGQNMPPPNNPGYGQNVPSPNNPGYGQNMPRPSNMPPPTNPGYGQNMPRPNNMPPPTNPGYGQNMPPPNNPGYGQNMPPSNNIRPPNNPGYGQNMPPPNNPGYGGQGNPAYQNTMPKYQGGGMPYQNTQVPNQQSNNYGPQGNMGYQGQDVPGKQYQ